MPTKLRYQHDHADVLGVYVSAINMKRAVALADERIIDGQPGYVCVTGVHGVMEAQSNSAFRTILNEAFMNVPDGMPMTWVGRLQGFRNMDRVYGPDFMLEMCRLSAAKGYRVFLYGGNEGVAPMLGVRLAEMFPGLLVVGTYTPPFRPLNAEEEKELHSQISSVSPDVIWVGLSTPKQETFIAQHSGRLSVPLMVGVGAAFDIHTGRVRDAPRWMKVSGLQWFHRLLQEPRRLGRRYLVNNPQFVFRMLVQLRRAKRVRLLKGTTRHLD